MSADGRATGHAAWRASLDALESALRGGAARGLDGAAPWEAPRDLAAARFRADVPRSERRRLGAFMTPEWLAVHVLTVAGYDGRDGLVIDPTCGTGVFLVAAAHRRRAALGERASAASVLEPLRGWDVSPDAARAARLNLWGVVRDLPGGDTPPPDDVVRVADVLAEDAMGADGRADWVVGNPPWIGWEALPEARRARAAPLWERYGLYGARGMQVVLGGGRKDLAPLVVLRALHRLARPDGDGAGPTRFALVVPDGLLRGGRAANGFRRLELPAHEGAHGGPTARRIRLDRVDDLVPVAGRVFTGATTRPIVMAGRVGGPDAGATEGSVRWVPWRPVGAPPRGARAALQGLTRVIAEPVADAEAHVAEPVPGDPHGPWWHAPASALPALRKLLGPSGYTAREGVNTGGANGVYHLDLLGSPAAGLVEVRNRIAGTKRVVAQREATLEATFVHPLVRPGDVSPFQATPSAHVLMVQDPASKRGLDAVRLQTDAPRTLAWLEGFEPELRARAAWRRYFTKPTADGGRRETGPWWSMFNVGPWTMAPYKVAWARVGLRAPAALLEGRVLPQETLTFVPFDDREAACFLLGLWNSAPVRAARRAAGQVGGKNFAGPHAVTRLALPAFDGSDTAHRELATLAARAVADRDAAPDGLDTLSATVLGLSAAELEATRATLAVTLPDKASP